MYTVRIACIAVLIFVSTLAHCQALPDAPGFEIQAVSLGASTAFDAVMTIRDTHQGIREAGFPRGSSWLYGRTPGTARTSLTMALMSGTGLFTGYRLEHSRHPKARLVGNLLVWTLTAMHAEGGAQDLWLQSK